MEQSTDTASSEGEVQLRRFPYPYRAMLALCSDLDRTPDRHVYWEIMRFLNTTEATSLGPGVGLEVGNSIYFDMPSDQFAYWNTDDAGRAMVRGLIRSGHIDCLHSYGDLAATRADAGRALEELARHDCRLEVWVDHGVALSNFGADVMRGHGDELGHPAYHADLTVGHGIRYVWRGRVTSVIGQDVPAILAGVWTRQRPVVSARTVAKEAAKRLLARWGCAKYAMHSKNVVLRRSSLRDGTPVREFVRSNPHWAGVSACDTGRAIGQVLTRPMLDHLVRRAGVCLLYTHLGKACDMGGPFDQSARAGLQRLADAYRAGQLLVTTTRRTLGFLSARDDITWSTRRNGDDLAIDVTLHNADLCDVAGLTFYVPADRRAIICVDKKELECVQRNSPDHTGRPSVSIARSTLEFPDI